MTHRGPFQPLPVCDSVISNPEKNIGMKMEELDKPVEQKKHRGKYS